VCATSSTPGRPGPHRRFKRVTGFSGSGTGSAGAAFLHGISETTQNDFSLEAPPALSSSEVRRSPTRWIDQSGNYKQFSLSDQISWEAQFARSGLPGHPPAQPFDS